MSERMTSDEAGGNAGALDYWWYNKAEEFEQLDYYNDLLM
jgi:hypothetical protein